MSQFTIDIDTGGTFTDGFFSRGQEYVTVKVDTTPHDLTVCFNQCIKEGAKKFGYDDVEAFLKQTMLIRLSTTIGTNSLIQRTGPKLGLIVTKGYEETLYQDNNPVLGFVLDRELVIGVDEAVSDQGEVLTPVVEKEIRQAVKKLLESGARGFVVSLKNAHLNKANEQKIRSIIQEDFPVHYLGAKPVWLASEISNRADDGIRTNAGVINAYLHRDMVRYLYKADEQVRQQGFPHNLLIAHSNGGVARVAKTKAMDTYNSGPAAGLMGSAYVGRLYGLDKIVTLDIGGTSTDVGLIVNAEPTYDLQSAIAGVPVHVPLIHVLSVGGGGGSIGKVTSDGTVEVGPESAGAVPGPACFNLGGTRPAVTDAALTLNWIDPDYFLGGAKKLDRQKAETAIEQHLSNPLNLSKEEAAFKVVDRLTDIGANALKQLAAERGYHIEEFALFSFGGGGGLFSAEIARKCGIKQVYTFPFSSVFSAFGLSTVDVTHTYETRLTNGASNSWETLAEQVYAQVERLKEVSFRDMRGEGFQVDDVQFELILEGKKADYYETFSLRLNGDAAHLHREIESWLADLNRDGQAFPFELLRLKAWVPISHYQFQPVDQSGQDLEQAIKAVRTIGWNGEQLEATIYDAYRLQPGHGFEGPALIESDDTTILVPPYARYQVDQYGNGILEV